MYTVMWKRQDEWVPVFRSFNPVECDEYANKKIVHGHITQRIEIHDGTGCLETVYDAAWDRVSARCEWTQIGATVFRNCAGREIEASSRGVVDIPRYCRDCRKPVNSNFMEVY